MHNLGTNGEIMINGSTGQVRFTWIKAVRTACILYRITSHSFYTNRSSTAYWWPRCRPVSRRPRSI